MTHPSENTEHGQGQQRNPAPNASPVPQTPEDGGRLPQVPGTRNVPGFKQRAPLGGDTKPNPTEKQVPKDHGRLWLVAGLGLLFAMVVYMVWGFVAPAVDPDVPPVIEGEEIRELP